jgi:signal transduction histidine kinase
MELMRRRDDRIPSVPGLISYLQTLTEREKAVLARELHDELGGLLVAASMDLAWLDKHLPRALDAAASGANAAEERDSQAAERTEVRRRLSRLKETVAGAVDIKRRVIEELRPTLLDNVGLFAALRWLVSDSSAHSKLEISFEFPPREPQFDPETSIALFRIAQAGLAVISGYRSVQSIALRLEFHAQLLTLSILGLGDQLPPDVGPPRESFELAAIRHRSAVLGGSIRFSAAASGEVGLIAWIPLETTGAC